MKKKELNDNIAKLFYDDSASESLFTRFKVYITDTDVNSKEYIEIAKGCILNQNCISIFVNDTLTQVNYSTIDTFIMDMKANGYIISFIDKVIKY